MLLFIILCTTPTPLYKRTLKSSYEITTCVIPFIKLWSYWKLFINSAANVSLSDRQNYEIVMLSLT